MRDSVIRDFRETIWEKAKRSPRFRRALLTEAVENLLTGDLETSKGLLRDYIKATIGYRALSEAAGVPEKSLIRMFGAKGNPRAIHLSRVIGALQQHEDVRLQVSVSRRVDAA